MFLSDGQVGKKYIAEGLMLDNKLKRRLQVLGLTKNTKVEILNKNFNGSLIFKVRGTRFAISKKISSSIKIKEVPIHE